MKIKYKLFLFLGIFIFVFMPKNVYAKEVVPLSSTLISGNNNYLINDGYLPTGTILSTSIASNNGYKDFGLNVTVYWSTATGDYNTFTEYPYVFLFFETLGSQEQFTITRTSSCNQSCFNGNNMVIKQVGVNPENNRRRYVLILPVLKQYDPGSGGTSFYEQVEDILRFTNLSGYSRTFTFTNILLSDTSDIDAIADYSTIITNANNNTATLANALATQAGIINNTAQDIWTRLGTINTNIINKFNAIINGNTNNTDAIINANEGNTNDILNGITSSTDAIDNQLTNVQGQIEDSANQINNSLNDESAPTNNDVSTKTQEWSNKLASTGPVSQMVLMPITLLNGYVSGLNSTCSPYNLGNLMGTDIVLPCINISNYVGSSLWSVIDILFSGFMIYAIGKKFVKIFNDFTNLRDNQMDELYGGGK